MFKTTALSITAASFTLFSSAVAAADGSDNGRSFELEVLSTATSQACDSSHDFHQEVVVCKDQSCDRISFTGKSSLSINLPPGARASLISSVSAARDGAITGDTRSSELSPDVDMRFGHTVEGRGTCLKSYYYEFRSK